jgi:endogenous inhibitor of DNA gyrase (YacG/DUF329 family)
MSAQPVVACPRCGAPAEFSPANRWRPFCSERCKLVDLGNWASERYRVPETEKPFAADDAEGAT